MVWCRSCSVSPASVAELGISVYGLVPVHLRPTSSPSAGVHCRVCCAGREDGSLETWHGRASRCTTCRFRFFIHQVLQQGNCLEKSYFLDILIGPKIAPLYLKDLSEAVVVQGVPPARPPPWLVFKCLVVPDFHQSVEGSRHLASLAFKLTVHVSIFVDGAAEVGEADDYFHFFLVSEDVG